MNKQTNLKSTTQQKSLLKEFLRMLKNKRGEGKILRFSHQLRRSNNNEKGK